MSLFNFLDPATNKSFAVKVPSGVSFEQAKAMFNQQLDTGALAGFGVGKTLSAATQAAGGLDTAKAMLSQTTASALGKLPTGASLNTITSALGPGGLAGANQVLSSLQGAGAGLATNAIGSASGAALAAVKAAGLPGIGGAGSDVAGLVTKAGTALTGAAAQAGSLANTAIKNLAGGLTGSVTNGINTADLVKQGASLPIPELSGTNVQAALSQAAKLVGQPHTKISDAKGLGKFGLNLPQLEKAGFVKPGLSDSLGPGASLTSVLSSATAFTGKDGIKNVSGLLNNENLQNNIQSGLMKNGLSDLKAAGIPVSNLNPGAIAGLATNAAKSVGDTLNNLAGKATSASKAAFDSVTKDTSFAVTLADTKVDKALLGQISAVPAVGTVNAETLNAAAKRILGNSKIFSVA